MIQKLFGEMIQKLEKSLIVNRYKVQNLKFDL